MFELKFIIANLAGLTFAVSFTWQIYKTIQLKAAEQISSMKYATILISEFLWTWWGVLAKEWVFVFWCAASMVGQMTVLFLYFYYGSKQKVSTDDLAEDRGV